MPTERVAYVSIVSMTLQHQILAKITLVVPCRFWPTYSNRFSYFVTLVLALIHLKCFKQRMIRIYSRASNSEKLKNQNIVNTIPALQIGFSLVIE